MNTCFRALLLAGMLASICVQADDFGTGPNQFAMDFVSIGHVGNTPDIGGWGSVAYEYRIGTYEVSIAKFNKVLSADNRVGDGDEDYWNTAPKAEGTNVPAARVSWLEAAKFCNWLTTSNAYTGAYLFDAIGTLTNVNRAAALSAYGTVYVIPSEDEWLKAGYFKADGTGYTDWPTGNSVPVAGVDEQYYFKGKPWAVGSGSIENNGTYDMAGNVFEWNEDATDGTLDDLTEDRRLHGGQYDETAGGLLHSAYASYPPWVETIDVGFRVAAIITLSPPPAPPIITIQNVLAAQREGTKLVDIFYDLSSDGTNTATVAVAITNGVAEVGALSLTGDVGSGTTTGSLKQIVWDAGADWGGNTADLKFTLSIPNSTSAPASVAALAVTGQTVSYQPGDDAFYSSGIALPSPRFTDTGSNSVIDNLTGLEWAKNPSGLSGNSTAKTWSEAVAFCSGLSLANQFDWRLPSQKEILSIIDFGQSGPPLPAGHPFIGIAFDDYWTGSSHPTLPSSHAATAFMSFGMLRHVQKTTTQLTWPVRGGASTGPAPVPQTGQANSYHSGDDGALQTGVAWPTPRFTDNGDGTVLDTLTGLEWAKEPHAVAGNASTMSWSNAIVFCEGVSIGSKTGWRLPNIKELESVASWGVDEPYAWLNSSATPFSGIHYQSYWTATPLDAANAWYANMNYINGPLTLGANTAGRYVWPVRNPSGSVVSTSAMASADTRDYSLAVSSAFGSSFPSAGGHSNYSWKSTVTASVDAVAIMGGTNYTCSGWNGSGSVPVLGGTTNTGAIVLTTVSSSIDWRWIVDADSDRMPDDWELLYYGSITGAVATADTDGDGYNAWQEYILGSNPTNSGSSFLFTPGTNSPPGEFSIDFTTVTGRLYTVECTDELGSGNWQVLTNFIGDGSAVQFIDPANIPACFYQIRIDWVE